MSENKSLKKQNQVYDCFSDDKNYYITIEL